MDRIGDYQVEREIRRDDVATTYIAVHLVLPRRASVRVLANPKKADAIAMIREVCLLEALQHPGVPRVFECGVLPDKRPWTAMELIEGPTLGELTRETPLAIVDLVLAIRTIGEVLEHAHARGVIHQRLGEGAIVRTQSRHAPFTIIGWGSAGTRDGVTPGDPARDIGALGALAFRGLTGRPYTGASARDEAPSAPAELAALIDDMLSETSAPAATEVRVRAAWLADSIVPRHTLPEMKSIDPFAVRINRG